MSQLSIRVLVPQKVQNPGLEAAEVLVQPAFSLYELSFAEVQSFPLQRVSLWVSLSEAVALLPALSFEDAGV
jgi:hypothetical protein